MYLILAFQIFYSHPDLSRPFETTYETKNKQTQKQKQTTNLLRYVPHTLPTYLPYLYVSAFKTLRAFCSCYLNKKQVFSFSFSFLFSALKNPRLKVYRKTETEKQKQKQNRYLPYLL